MTVSKSRSSEQQTTSPPNVMLGFLFGAWLAQTITAVADLRVADALAGGPLQIDELAGRVGAEPDALGRAMRAVISKGIFAQRDDGRYELTPLAELLRSDVPMSMAAMARFVGSPQEREHWSLLTQAIKTGASCVPTLRGKRFFEYLGDDPEFASVFNEAMVGMSAYVDAPVMDAYDFTPYGTIVDVAGGHGRLLAAILGSTPEARGVLFDLPDVVAGAAPLLEKLGVARRVRIAEGSFFDEIPPGGDAYVLKHIIHDWPDDEALQILRNVRRAAGTGAALLLVETIIPEDDQEFSGKIVDMEMLLFNNGRERTASEYRQLLDKADFEMIRVVDTATEFSIIQARAT
ncbi:methyltransferase [Mycobacterium intracellulare]|uniref:Methyltransferase n=1 Tax=Mycobacterium intracellulare subsp. chimaera TaxID=222805 RepID=A0A220YHU9_MYCIT|nr:methyltransferase [Mycobacterium intracellulare]ETZ27305.1 O-methyltransferase family protein [Mycobacterium intracellulare MIN_052511_1280]ASL11042.1 O-methyltransferase [Mycobacterium intracellulare subsp. chimaera]ASL16935.1 O-methyltransferase [Mycobacterium intracellulare subsp. chimaera]ASL22982.1 O-methyltransferase [Mycobacterium intracellulare subsp. chimaera]ASQ87922.1 hydroxyneurosporene methyltransferase [Mycobacterium intracellulare subsp. chimaera]